MSNFVPNTATFCFSDAIHRLKAFAGYQYICVYIAPKSIQPTTTAEDIFDNFISTSNEQNTIVLGISVHQDTMGSRTCAITGSIYMTDAKSESHFQAFVDIEKKEILEIFWSGDKPDFAGEPIITRFLREGFIVANIITP